MHLPFQVFLTHAFSRPSGVGEGLGSRYAYIDDLKRHMIVQIPAMTSSSHLSIRIDNSAVIIQNLVARIHSFDFCLLQLGRESGIRLTTPKP
ncbi:hypothetical protein CY34DRAFT_431990 [Suillus luteus UH-Slu-Lm8-n1]|uniref:Uncharacterized protein n=1 Tax=Suillus luteus UH-Slu-Lm8-n1 TaxID=930992 RepID=A0A0D0BU29_9AGAM|nr:hypothetical protein CY34DRAFT_431990 [Suillus luteus UH-Slu-Lm8-n1]